MLISSLFSTLKWLIWVLTAVAIGLSFVFFYATERKSAEKEEIPPKKKAPTPRRRRRRG
jgi:hypothetical protein